MSRILPIFFIPDLTRAILENRKTATRRLVKFNKGQNPNWTGYVKDGLILYDGNNRPCSKRSQYQIGDILYVRESAMIHCMKNFEKKVKMLFSADNSLVEFTVSDKEYDRLLKYSDLNKFLSPYWLTKETARLWLKVTDVRVERLRDITEEQAVKEGFDGTRCGCDSLRSMCVECCGTGWREPPTVGFMYTWDGTINKKDISRYGFFANPWVWVIEFERCEKPDPCILRGREPEIETGPCIGYGKPKLTMNRVRCVKDAADVLGMIWRILG